MPPKEIIRTEVKVLIQPTQEATTDASAPKDPTITWSSLYFLSFYIIHNSMCWCFILWDWMYYWWYIIYRHHFLFKLGIFLFPLLTNSFAFFFLNMWFLLYDSDSVSLRRYHFLPIFQSLRRSSVILDLKCFLNDFLRSRDRSSGQPTQVVRIAQVVQVHSNGYISPIEFRNIFWMNFIWTLIWKL